MKGMKILVTGSSGMVGKNVLEHPEIKKDEVLAPRRRELNLLNADDVLKYLEKHRPEMIVHCAGYVGGIYANMNNLLDFLVQNLDMGKNLVLGAKQTRIKNFINLGSSCFYPKDIEKPIKENRLLSGALEPTNEGYAIAKIAVAKMCEYITDALKDYNYKTLIPCNLYGRWDNFNLQSSHFIPAMIRKIYDAHIDEEESVEIWGNGMARREILYAGDLADFILYAIKNLKKLPNRINVGSGSDFTINEYYQMAANIIGYKGQFEHNLDKPVGMKRKVMDISKLQATGWKPKHSLEDGFKKTLDFYIKTYLPE